MEDQNPDEDFDLKAAVAFRVALGEVQISNAYDASQMFVNPEIPEAGLFTSEGIEEFENDFQKLSDDEIGEDDRVKEDGVDTIEEEKQDDEAEEKDQVAGELVKKQGARKRQFKPTVGAGGTSVLRMVQAELANAKEITLNSWRRRELVWFHFYSVMLGGIQ
ncbi:hypothetical protein F2Q69_00010081 [Brassica cretica]|uniref:Uncharacterized protein n=1 Tax=Brassica cretica TaxID=69181 RepID=A0A8S9P518_BRACR|nr:hypothetical protein F2Q69_00010081 [Brassica cretica]